MRTFLLAVLALAIGYGVYTYLHDPDEAKKLVKSFTVDLWPATQTAWVPPTYLPTQPNWTWTTTDGKVYHNVKIVRIDAACVTILHSNGGGRVPLSTLSPDMQRYFNYDPVAATQTDTQFAAGVAEEKAIETKQTPSAPSSDYYATDDYSSALAEAKASKKLLLLHFTGSDWCPYCKRLDQEVLSTDAYQTFSASHFVTVTLDFPHNSKLASDIEAQNSQLQGKYNITGFPTLLVTDIEGREIGRITGLIEGGPQGTIASLQNFAQKGGLANK